MLVEGFARGIYQTKNKTHIVPKEYIKISRIVDIIASVALATLGALAIAGILPFSAMVGGALVGGGILYILVNLSLRCTIYLHNKYARLASMQSQ